MVLPGVMSVCSLPWVAPRAPAWETVTMADFTMPSLGADMAAGTLVESLDQHPSVRAAFDAAGIDPRRWPSFEKALASLAASDFLVPEQSAAA